VDTRPTKPVVFVASPYSIGDAAINVHFQCAIFDELLSDGRVLPIVPLWTHFQHTVFPRPYSDWIAYDKEILKLCDCCLRLNAVNEKLQYEQSESSGADAEAQAFKALGKPVFFSIAALYEWIGSNPRLVSPLRP
jgi:hypothetical protein